MTNKKKVDNKEVEVLTVEQEDIELEDAQKQAKEEMEKLEEVFAKKPPVIPQVVRAVDEKVTVVPKFTGERFVGGNWYKFVKGKEIKVPVVVKYCLRNSGAIYL